MNKNEFIDYCEKIGIKITEEKYLLLIKYMNLLQEWNNKFNLTTITEEKDVLLKHFYDSLCINKSINLNEIKTLCDIGTGAGFPGLVIKIVFDSISVDLVESSTKKCEFLNEVIRKLNLNNINVINERAEIYAKKYRETYDVVTCRAVSSLKVISEIGIPLVKVGGYFLPLKSNIDIELNESKDIIINTGCILLNVINYNLPIENSYRSIPVIVKKTITNVMYPREYNKIIKNP
jgi:16S rRNA (guanine527-N7)-methyltransferase